MFPLGCHLFPALLLGHLFGPGLILDKVLFGKGSLVFFFQLGQHFLSLLLSVLVLVADGVCVHCCLSEVGERFPPQFRHLWQAKEGKTTS